MTLILPRREYGQLTRLAGLLTYSLRSPSHLKKTVVKETGRSIKNELTAAGLYRIFTYFPFNLHRCLTSENNYTILHLRIV